MSTRAVLPLILLAVFGAGIYFAITTRGPSDDPDSPGSSEPATPAQLWDYLEHAIRFAAYGDEAVEAVGLLGGDRAERLLVLAQARLDEVYEDEDLAMRALYVRAQRGEEDLLDLVRECLEEAEWDWGGEWAARTLRHVNEPGATELLGRLAEYEDDWDVQTAAVMALAHRGDARAREALKPVLDTEDEDVAAAAAGALLGLGDPEADVVAEHLMAEDDGTVLPYFAKGLGATGNDRVLPWLTRLAASEDSDVRAAAAAGFGDLSPASARAGLDPLLSDQDPTVRLAVAVALARKLSDDRGAKELADAARNHPLLETRVESLRALAELKREGDRPLFEEIFAGEGEDEVNRLLKIWAAYALLRSGS